MTTKENKERQLHINVKGFKSISLYDYEGNKHDYDFNHPVDNLIMKMGEPVSKKHIKRDYKLSYQELLEIACIWVGMISLGVMVGFSFIAIIAGHG